MDKRRIPASLLVALGLGSEGCDWMLGPCLEPPVVEEKSEDQEGKETEETKGDDSKRNSKGRRKKINVGDGYCLLVPPCLSKPAPPEEKEEPPADGKSRAEGDAKAAGEAKGGMARSDVIDALLHSGRLPADIASRLRDKATSQG